MPDGTPITSVPVGQSFLLQGFVQDLTPAMGGVFAAYLDVVYPGTAATVQGTITFGADFPNGQSGSTSVAGLVDEVGAFDGLDRLGGTEALLFSVPMQASQAGNFDVHAPIRRMSCRSIMCCCSIADDPVPDGSDRISCVDAHL